MKLANVKVGDSGNLLRQLQITQSLRPPLCKGRWHAVRRDGGIVAAVKICRNVKF
jgi:hypothetical protein